ncbi:hypothetical protein A8B75_18740 [Sphingomonadales bacterium EhC05]|nr:hypothetical protein A8B75_18740 [Sphingomonadales bacterium EhC05]
MTDKEQPKNQPKNLREGALNLAIWKNDGEHGPKFSSNLTRSYKDQEGEWQKTSQLREQDQLPASRLFSRGHDHIREQKQERAKAERSPSQKPSQGQSQGQSQGPSR